MDFFVSKGHTLVPSAPIVVKNDPTLMFTNAGMNQFKDYFLGNKLPPYKRVVDTQKCLRVSGKHNDLEEVGVDTYHHTMFEMLGNWSFGDYFKKEAIAWSWELLTAIYGIDKERLYVTIFEGDQKENLPKDNEAYQEWMKWLPEERILLGDKKDNFWEMGDTGPCGPCTEIHVDCRPDSERKIKDGKELVNKDHPQVIEIWNNVFIQYNRLKDGRLEPLPSQHVDTGMGLERLVRVLQGKTSNYDTDLFSETLAETERLTGEKYDYGISKQAIAFRVIADHIRAIAFTIADGQLPSNTGAGYVIRRILRRAVRYYYSYLNYKQPLLYQLMPVLAQQFEKVFPELSQQLDFVMKVVKEEETAFLRTLEKGLKRMEDILTTTAAQKETILSGKEVFELYDTYGFPVDLTRLIASENKLSIDEAGFEAEMQKQKLRSRAATVVDTEDWIILDEFARNEFVGYDTLQSQTKVVKYRKIKSKGKTAYQLVLEVTPFYAESGGQVGDTGVLLFGNTPIIVTDTRKENDLIVHYTEKIPDDLTSEVIAQVNVAKRKQTAVHHSATHLLHAALRNVLGTHVTQKGSLVNEDHLRFDFSHMAKMSEQEIAAVEKLVNQKIRENIPVIIKEMPKDEALKMGAMALFGEKYGERVRVVIIDAAYSVELCGGTHVGATGELGLFKIIHETAIAAGVRRLEAVSGDAAEQFINQQAALLEKIKTQLKNPKDPDRALENLLNEKEELKKQLELAEQKLLSGIILELLHQVQVVNGTNFIGSIVEVTSVDALKKICLDLKYKIQDYVIVLCATVAGKAAVVICIDEKLVESKNLDAGKIIKEQVAPLIKGGGGGQKTLATAGGQETGNLKQVMEAVKTLIR